MKLLIRPSRKSVVSIREKLREAWRDLSGQSLTAVLWRLNPIIRGWANYFRVGVSSETFGKLDEWMHLRAKLYARRTHPRKPGYWLAKRYWGRLNPARNDHWVFGDKGTGRFLLKFRWSKIERHILVRGTASPDDPALGEYWWARRKVNVRHLTEGDVKLAERQDWVCPVCGGHLINGEPLERHHMIPRCEGGSEMPRNRVLVHIYCHQQLTAIWRNGRRESSTS